jgi:hypothetical protein
VAGAKKATALRDVLEGRAIRDDRPAAGVQPTDGTVTWLVDVDAAGLLARTDCRNVARSQPIESRACACPGSQSPAISP